METDSYSVYVFGDSHSRCFSREEKTTYSNIKIHNKYQSSVSMKGLTNPTNTLNYNNVILDTLKSLQLNSSSNIVFVMKFGQVDIEYNYYYKLYKKGESVVKKVFYNKIIKDYINYITSLKKTYPSVQFIVNGVNMPNHYDITKYIQQTIHAPTPHIEYKDQFEGSCLFNKVLQTQCELSEIPYFDLTSETTTGKGIKKEFIGRDHHLSGAEGVGEVVNNNTYEVFRSKLLDTVNHINKSKQVNQKCIYTFIVGGYDSIKEPKIKTPGWDYVCVTDDPNLKSNNWKVVLMSKEDRNIQPLKRRAMSLMIGFQNYIGSHYDTVITVGGQMVINTNLDSLLRKYQYNSTYDAAFLLHPNRNCVYEEGAFVAQVGRDSRESIDKCLSRYHQEGYPRDNGLYATGVMILNNKSENLKKLLNLWLEVYRTSATVRDQMSLNYSIWKLHKDRGTNLIIKDLDFIQMIEDDKDIYTQPHQKTIKHAMTNTSIVDLEQKINQLYQTPSDINEHLPTLLKYGQECEHITEMGVRGIISTWAFLGSAPKTMRSYDIQDPGEWEQDINQVYETSKHYGKTDFKFTQANVLEIEIEPTELLFIDTWHAYKQLKSELRLHGNKASKYIVLHDTTSFEFHDETSYEMWGDEWKGTGEGLWPAVEEFLKDNPHWSLHERFTNNNGLTVLKRK